MLLVAKEEFENAVRPLELTNEQVSWIRGFTELNKASCVEFYVSDMLSALCASVKPTRFIKVVLFKPAGSTYTETTLKACADPIARTFPSQEPRNESERSVEQTSDRTSDRPSDRGRASDRPSDRTSDRPSDRPTDREQPSDRPLEMSKASPPSEQSPPSGDSRYSPTDIKFTPLIQSPADSTGIMGQEAVLVIALPPTEDLVNWNSPPPSESWPNHINEMYMNDLLKKCNQAVAGYSQLGVVLLKDL